MKVNFAKMTIWFGSVGLLAALGGPSRAEDIDLYAGVTGTSGRPNVLFYIDNTSNWSNNAQKWTKASVQAKCDGLTGTVKVNGVDVLKKDVCTGYVNQIFGTNSDLRQGQVEVRALRLVLNELVCSSGQYKVNAGLMLFNDVGTVDSASIGSGYIRHRIAPLEGAYCTTFLDGLNTIDSKVTDPDWQANSASAYGTALYEAFKYFGGWTNPAGVKTATAGADPGATGFGPIRNSLPMEKTKGGVTTVFEDPLAFTDSARTTYRSPLVGEEALCGNNYIVLIGNTWPNQEWGTNVNASPYPSNTQFQRLSYDQGYQIYPKPLLNSDKSDVRFADEWAKFLYDTDVSDAPGQQNIRMFTVDVWNASADAKQGKLLASMADQSGDGGHFTVGGDLYELINAFKAILSQIAAVNSVFASASLPVSVNAQGTFLNQVFMGVFRPDAGAQQRWMGNLKQYQFAFEDAAKTQLILADKNKANAVDAQNTGFIQNCAMSFWTSDSGEYWKTITGYSEQSTCSTLQQYSGYSDAPDGPIVERGGAAQQLRTLGHGSRNLRTCTSTTDTTLQDFTTSNLSGKVAATLVQWLRGENTGDGNLSATGDASTESYNLAASATRPTVHGDVVHSRPLAVNYGGVTSGTETPDVVVFYGAGDGTLRAVDGSTASGGGNELWSFIAPEHWTTLDRVRTNNPLVAYPSMVGNVTGPTPTPRSWYFDGNIGGYQERDATTVSKLWIYPTMRRGGRSVYAFDVTKKPGTGTNQPALLWRYNETTDVVNGAKMGQSWSTPVAIRVKGITAPLVVFGAGYDSCEDDEDPVAKCASLPSVDQDRGRGIVIVDAQYGASVAANYRFIKEASGELDASAGRFVADVAPVDINNDGYIDVLYAVDTRGNVWRINTSNPASNYDGWSVANWKVEKVAVLGDWSQATEKRKLMYAPSTVKLGNQVTILIGSGDREKPAATSNASKVVNRFYGIRDDVSVTTDLTTDPHVVPPVAYGYGPESAAPGTAPNNNLKDVTNLTTVDPASLIEPLRGWFRNLSSTSEPYEQVVTTPLTIAGVTYFNTYQAKKPDSVAAACTNLGTARGYQVNFQTGTGVPDLPLVTEFKSQGMPPSPVGGVVMIDGKPVPFVIGGPGPTPISPKKIVPLVRPDRKPVFRTIRIDK